MEIGTKVRASSKSRHAGQTGVVVKDYGTMLVVLADDQSYDKAFKSSGYEGKIFQLDEIYAKEIKQNVK